MSSSTSGPDSSPVTPTGRLSRVAGKTLAGLRRISNQVTPVVSMRDSYFPPLSARSVHSRESSAGPTTPTSATRIRGLETPSSYFPPESPAGLGMGLSDDSQTSWSSKGTVLLSETPTAELSRSPQPQARGRRKPVPKMFDGDLMDGIATLQVEEAHAM